MEDAFIEKSTLSDRHRRSQLRDADDLSFTENLRLAWGNFVLAVRYVMYSIMRDRRSFYVGVWTVAIVVGFVSVLASAVQNSPAIFLAIAEDEVGQMDMLLSPTSESGGSSADTADPLSSFFLNQTFVESATGSAPEVLGTAPRWTFLGQLINRDRTTRNASCIVLVIDSRQEQRIDLGTRWDRRPLGEQETYVSKSLLDQIGVAAGVGQRARLRIDLFAELVSLGVVDGATSEEALARQLLEQAGVNLDQTFEVDVGGTVVGGAVTIPDGTTVTVDGNAAFDALFPVVRDALVLDEELIVLDAVDSPDGKWPKALGNVVLLEKSFVEKLLADQVDNTIAANQAALTAAGVDTATFSDVTAPLREGRMSEFALQVVVQYADRDTGYLGDSQFVKDNMIDFTNDAFTSLGVGFNASATLPIADSLVGSQFVQLFLDQIFNSVVFLLGLLGTLVIYSLLLGDVESKTYEYGMLRALGMRHNTLTQLLLTQAVCFSVPGIILGFTIAQLLNLVVVGAINSFVETDVTLWLHGAGWIVGIVLGTAIPLFANVVPIKRALSNTLRDALDLYHQTFSEVTVRMLRLSELGLSPLQLSAALMLVLIGFVTYYLVPLSFVFQDLSLFLTILNSILLMMLLGLVLMAGTLQPTVERLFARVVMQGKERRLLRVVEKNLAGHRSRNRKTAYMITIAVAFIIFAGSLFALQARSLTETLEMFLGADVVVFSPSRRQEINLRRVEELLDQLKVGSESVDENVAAVQDYTWVSYPLQDYDTVHRARFGTLAQYPTLRSNPYGVQRNFLRTAFTKFVVVTEEVSPQPGGGDVVARLHEGAGRLVLPVEGEVNRVPPLVVSGRRASDPVDTPRRGRSLDEQYNQYLDLLASEATRSFASVELDRALSMRVQFDVPVPGDPTNTERSSVTYLSKGRAMLSKLPGFFFSSYQSFAFGAPAVTPMEQMTAVVNEVIAERTGNGTSSAEANVTFFTPETLPKQRLLVKLREGVDSDGRARVVNGLRSAIDNDLIFVQDTESINESVQEAATALNLFFVAVAVVALTLCFFAAMLSFAANIRENAREFGILRALGLDRNQVLRCYLYEAGAVVFASFLLGSIVGMLIASTLTLQFNLFVEMPFRFTFPTMLFTITLVGCVVVAIFSSYLPAIPLMRAQISRVVKGVQWVF